MSGYNKNRLYIILMVVLAAASIVFAGCKGEPEEKYYVFDENTMTIASDGRCDFMVVYPEKEYNSSEAIRENVTSLVNMTLEKTGATLVTEVVEALFYEEEEFQILVGDTGFPESDEVISGLDYNDYEIRRIGRKIVVAGGSTSATATALEEFCKLVFKDDGNSYIDYVNDMNVKAEGEYTVKNITINAVDISEYAIVLSEDETVIEDEFAVMVQQAIAKACGSLLKITDKVPENGKAIYIGSGSDKADALALTEYEILVENGNVHICAGSASAYDSAFTAFCDIFTEKETVEVVDGFSKKANLEKNFKENANMIGNKTGDIRILVHNIFGGDQTPTINPTRRFKLQREIYMEYDADILMLQEFSPTAGRAVSGLKSAGFSEVLIDAQGIRLYTPIFYNADTVEVIDAGRYLYTYVCTTDSRVKNDSNSKGVTWAVMKIKETGKMLIVLNTHLYWNADKSDLEGNKYETSDLRYIAGANLARLDNVRELFMVLDELREVPEYADLPVVLGGDLNSKYNDLDLNTVITLHEGKIALGEIEKHGMKSAQLNAPLADTRTTWSGYPKYDSFYGYYYSYGNPKKNKQKASIDHIFYMGENLDVHVFDVIDTTFARKTSDHLPIYVDVSVG